MQSRRRDTIETKSKKRFQRYAYRKEGTHGGALRHLDPENELQSMSFCLLDFHLRESNGE